MPQRIKARNGIPISGGANNVFLSPDWINRVVARVEASKNSDPHFSNLISNISLTVVYVIKDVPPHVAPWYGNSGQAILSVRIHKGAVQQVTVQRRPPADGEADVIVTTDYETARRLLVGELRPASTLMNKGVTAKPMNGFRGWPALVTKSVLVASKVLRTARKEPTDF